MLTPRPLSDDPSGALDAKTATAAITVTATATATATSAANAVGLVQGNCSDWPLVEIIELKWLLAGEGIHIHVERLQSDSAYACRAFNEAAASASPTLRATALRLRHRLLPGS